MRRVVRVAIALGLLWLLWRGGDGGDESVTAAPLTRIRSEAAFDSARAVDLLLEGTVHPIVANDSVRYGDRFVFERRAHRTVANGQDGAKQLVTDAQHRPAVEFRFAAEDGGLLIAADSYTLDYARSAPRSRFFAFNERNVGFAVGDSVIATAVRLVDGTYRVVSLAEGPFDRYAKRTDRARSSRGFVSLLLRGCASLLIIGIAFSARRAPPLAEPT